MIIATAGHVDHGKTALIRALTGIDTDRLPEEKRRGLSIDLGFAYQPLDDGTVLGFVDVPGHEKFVRNMLAGVSGIDMGLLVVAADDGVMPQTREHTAILDLMGLTACVAVITKVDRVDDSRISEVRAQIEDLLGATGMAGAPILMACAPKGSGVEAVRCELLRWAKDHIARASSGHFRMSIDRCFTLRGIGLITTGTVISGLARVGDRLLLSPKGLEVRVRGIRAQDQASEQASAGNRCALNLAGKGLSESTVRRGNWVVEAPIHAPTRRVDARVRVLASEARVLKHWTPVHLHIGAAHVTGRVAVLEAGSIKPGDSGLVQLVLNDDIVAAYGDRLVLRDQSATRTIGGGTIVDSASPKRGRARPVRLAWLGALSAPGDEDALIKLLDLSPSGVGLKRFQRIRNLTDAEADTLLHGSTVHRVGRGEEELLIASSHWRQLSRDLAAGVAKRHEEAPQSLGPTATELRTELPTRVAQPLVDQALRTLVETGRLARTGLIVHLPEHRVQLGPEGEALWKKVGGLLGSQSGSPPSLNQAAEALNMDAAALQAFLKRASRAGLVMQVTRNRFIPVSTLASLAAKAEQLAETQKDRRFVAAQFRDCASVGRNFAIDLLEFFDRSGFTQRVGDERRIRCSAHEAFGIRETDQ